jgi:hypothetical protein
LYQNKKLCTSKEPINTTKMEPTEWDNVFVNCVYDKALRPEIHKELVPLLIKNQVIGLKDGQRN